MSLRRNRTPDHYRRHRRLAAVQHGDGTSAPWHPGLAPRALGLERRMHRNACYVLVVGLSMMRDSEKRAELRLMQHSATKTMS